MHPPFVSRRAVGALVFLAAGTVACANVESPQPLTPGDLRSATSYYGFHVPSEPLNVAATAGDASASVSWQPPEWGGRSAITSYSIVSSPGTIRVTVDSGARRANVTGLTNGTSYTFVVYATNKFGTGPGSSPSNAATPQAAVVDTTTKVDTSTSTPTSPSATGRWVSGYYVGYQSGQYPETSVDFSKMTHVIVGAIEATATGGVTTNYLYGAATGWGMAKTLSSRAHQAGRKALLMLGGAGYRNNIVTSATSYRAAFVANLLTAMDTLGYDGIDVDWEPITSSDQPVLLQLMQDLRAARPGIILTVPVGWSWLSTNSWYAQLASVVDQVNIMSYSMAGGWSGWTSWHSSALTGETSSGPSSVSRIVNAYRAAGVPAAKLGVGIGAYGSCWRGPTGPGQSLGSGIVAGDGTMSYANIVAGYYSSATYRWDASAQVPYLSSSSGIGAQACTFLSYEDPQSVTAKGNYVRSNGLGGTIMWTINEQHIGSAASGQQDPLLAAAYSSIAP